MLDFLSYRYIYARGQLFLIFDIFFTTIFFPIVVIYLYLNIFLQYCKAPKTASDIDAIERKFIIIIIIIIISIIIIIIITLTQPAVYPIKTFLSRTLTIVR